MNLLLCVAQLMEKRNQPQYRFREHRIQTQEIHFEIGRRSSEFKIQDLIYFIAHSWHSFMFISVHSNNIYKKK